MQTARKNDIKQLEILRKRADFVAMNKKAKRWTAQGLVLQAMANEQEKIRVGFTVTKKTDKSAVRRNRMKRRLRAIAYDILPKDALPDHDYVLIARRETASKPYEELLKDLKWCLKKLELRK